MVYQMCELRKSNYRNWVKGELALKVSKEGTEIQYKKRKKGDSDLPFCEVCKIPAPNCYTLKSLDPETTVCRFRQRRNEIAHKSTMLLENNTFIIFFGSVLLILEEIELEELFQQTVKKIDQLLVTNTIEIEITGLETVQHSQRRQLDIAKGKQNDQNQQFCFSDTCTQLTNHDHNTQLKGTELSISHEKDLHESSDISCENTSLFRPSILATQRNYDILEQRRLHCYLAHIKPSHISLEVPELTKQEYGTDTDYTLKMFQYNVALGNCSNMLYLLFLDVASEHKKLHSDPSLSHLDTFWATFLTQNLNTHKFQNPNTDHRLQNQNTDADRTVLTVFDITESESFLYSFGSSLLSECLELEVENIKNLFIFSFNDGIIIPMKIFDAWMKRSTFRSLGDKKGDVVNSTMLLQLSLKSCVHKPVDDQPDCSKKTKDIQSYIGPEVCLHAPVSGNASTVPPGSTDTQHNPSTHEDTNTPSLEENVSLNLRKNKLMCSAANDSYTVDLKLKHSGQVSENLDDSLKKDDEKSVIFKEVICNGMANARFKSDMVVAPVSKKQGEKEETGQNSHDNPQEHDNASSNPRSESEDDNSQACSSVSNVLSFSKQSTTNSNEISVDGHTVSGASRLTCMEKLSTECQSNQTDSSISPSIDKEFESQVQTPEGSSLHTACENPVVTNGTGIHPSDLPSPEVDHSEIERFEPLMQIIDKIADGQRVPPQITMRYEMLRFCTLRSFPKENKPYITRLAQAGFYYANSGDEVVCYTCARRRSNWREDDIPMEIHQQLNPNCKFLLQNSEVNIPIRVSENLLQTGIRQTVLVQQQNGYHTDPSATSNTALQNAVQNSDQTSIQTNSRRQNTTTATSSSYDTIPAQQTQERAHGNFVQAIATSSMAREQQLHQAAVSSNTLENLSSTNSLQPASQNTAEGRNLLSKPKYPKYATKTVRVTSFNDCGHIVVPPECLAEAGFFYASFGDCVRCFQCGVGLRHWSEEDDPWIEHSRWSKDCSYVKAMKGQEFVNLVQMAVQYSQNNENEQASGGNITGTNQGAHGGADRDNLMHTDAAQSVLEMGYHPDLIRKAIRSIKELNDREELTATNLMEKIFELEESEQTNSEQQSQTSIAQSLSAASEVPAKGANTENNSTQSQRHSEENSSVQSMALLSLSVPRDDMKSMSAHSSGSESSRAQKKSQLLEQKKLKEENEKMKQQSICTKCRQNDVCIVFLPCGHLVTCETCAPTVRYCTVEACGKYIKGTVRTYLA